MADRSREGESRQLGANPDVDPADGDTIEIGEESRWRRPISDLLAEELLARRVTGERLHAEASPRLAQQPTSPSIPRSS
jgi:hypothetical protein